MQRNITKEKGDIGVAMAIADLTKRGYSVAIPLAEHLPFDLIVISAEAKLARVSVKYSNNAEKVSISLRTISTNSKGYVVKRVNKNDLDGFVVYSPITNECYYVGKDVIGNRINELSLRLTEPNILKCDRFLYAKHFLNPEVLFKGEITR